MAACELPFGQKVSGHIAHERQPGFSSCVAPALARVRSLRRRRACARHPGVRSACIDDNASAASAARYRPYCPDSPTSQPYARSRSATPARIGDVEHDRDHITTPKRRVDEPAHAIDKRPIVVMELHDVSGDVVVDGEERLRVRAGTSAPRGHAQAFMRSRWSRVFRT